MSYPPDFLRHLRDTIADLYHTPTSLLRLAADSGLDTDRLDTSGSPLDGAYRLVELALDSNRLIAVQGRMQAEYPENPAVQELAMWFLRRSPKA